jgi:lycopene cyclase domain-containing protein
MKYTYLLINVFTIIFPLLRSFEPRIYFIGKWKYFFPSIISTGIFFLIWDYIKTSNGVWSFNDRYITGIKLGVLPIEEILFFITVPYACMFIYEAVGLFGEKKIKKGYEKYIVIAVSILSLVSSFFFIHKAYTFSVLFIGGIVFPIAMLLFAGNQANKFFITYAISLIPMLLVNGLLTALPVVVYNDTQNLGIRIGTIPVEDFLYSAILLVTNISIYEWLRNRSVSAPATLIS